IDRVFMVTALAVVFALAASLTPNPVAAQSESGFESETFGFSVEWDEEVWIGEPVELDDNGEGIMVESVTSWAMFQALDYTLVDTEACLTGMADIFADDEGEQIEDFGIAPFRMNRP